MRPTTAKIREVANKDVGSGNRSPVHFKQQALAITVVVVEVLAQYTPTNRRRNVERPSQVSDFVFAFRMCEKLSVITGRTGKVAAVIAGIRLCRRRAAEREGIQPPQEDADIRDVV